MGNDRALAQQFLDNCKPSKTPWCPLPSELLEQFLSVPVLVPYGRIFIALWLKTVAKPRSHGTDEIEISCRQLAEASSTSPSDVSRMLWALGAENVFLLYNRGNPIGMKGRRPHASDLVIHEAMLDPEQLAEFFQALQNVLEDEAEHACHYAAKEFGKRVWDEIANARELRERVAAQEAEWRKDDAEQRA